MADAESVMQHALVATRRGLDAAIQGIEDARVAAIGDATIPIRSVCSADATKFASLLDALKTCETVSTLLRPYNQTNYRQPQP